MSETSDNDTGAGQLQDEIIGLITRYAQEGNMSVAECVGVLEIVKAELIAKAMESGG